MWAQVMVVRTKIDQCLAVFSECVVLRTSSSSDGLFLLFFCSTSLSLDDSEDETSHDQLLSSALKLRGTPSVLDFLFFDLRFFSPPRGAFGVAILLFFAGDGKSSGTVNESLSYRHVHANGFTISPLSTLPTPLTPQGLSEARAAYKMEDVTI